MTALSQKEKDSKRSTTLFRIERVLLSIIHKIARKNRTTAKYEIDYVLRQAFKVPENRQGDK